MKLGSSEREYRMRAQCTHSARTVRVLELFHRPPHLFYTAVHVFTPQEGTSCTRYDHCMCCTVACYSINHVLFMASL